MIILHNDVRVICGDTGDPAGNCNLSGGWVQILSLPSIFGRDVQTNNLVIEGVTFTGRLTTFGPSIDMKSAGVALAAPGVNMEVKNCVWDDFHGYRGAYVAHKPALSASATSPKSAELTMVDVQVSLFCVSDVSRR